MTTQRKRIWKEFPLSGEDERRAVQSVWQCPGVAGGRTADITGFAFTTNATVRECRQIFRLAGLPWRGYVTGDDPREGGQE